MALRRLMERGWRSDDPTRRDMAGLQDLLDRLRSQRQELLERFQLGDALADVREELESIVEEERAGVERRLDGASRRRRTAAPTVADHDDAQLRSMLRDMAAKRLDKLDALPSDVGDQIRQLREYDFMEPHARERFDALVERLPGPCSTSTCAGCRTRSGASRPDDLAANREMVRDLNQLLQERLDGREPTGRSEFLARHGSFFPGARNLDDIIEQLAERMAAMQSLLRSMSAEQRAELQSMMEALLRDDRLRWDLAQLAATLDQLLPGGLGERLRFSGSEPLGLEGALQQIGRLQAMDALQDQLEGVGGPGDIADVDRDELRDLVDEAAVRDLDALDDLARQLEKAGYLERQGDRLELTPRGTRRIGQKVLDDLFGRLRRDAFGGHRITAAGRGGEREETTKPYEFGDPFHLDLNRTLANALEREENAPRRGRATPASRLGPERLRGLPHRGDHADLDRPAGRHEPLDAPARLLRRRQEGRGRAAHPDPDRVPARRPLGHRVRVLRPRDPARGARRALWHGYEYGTNLQHGLMLARRILARQHGGNREIVVITDGEPTAHFEDGQVEFSYPPTRRTIQETLREVVRCTKDGITINTFMLERSRALAEFVALVTRLNRGRAFYATPERLGEYVLVDFVSRRTRKVS